MLSCNFGIGKYSIFYDYERAFSNVLWQDQRSSCVAAGTFTLACSFNPSFIHCFTAIKQELYYVPDIVLDIGNIVINKVDLELALLFKI